MINNEIFDDSGYRIGKVTIDSSFHTQSADELYFRYFGNEVLYSIVRTIHDDDIEEFTDIIKNIKKDEVKRTVLRMKGQNKEYRRMLVTIAANCRICSDNGKYFDIIVKDALLLDDNAVCTEKMLNSYRFVLSLMEDVVFKYNKSSNIITVFKFDFLRDNVFISEELDYFKYRVCTNKLVQPQYVYLFEKLCNDIKEGVPRFQYEIENSILSNGEQMEYEIINGITIIDEYGGCNVIGTISAINPNDKTKSISLVIENNRDPLTDVMSQKAIVNYAKNKIEAKPKSQIVLVIIDIDDLKYINDSCGHLSGDEILCRTASILKNEIGSRGAAGRIGGDEFMLVLEDIHSETDLRSVLRAIRSNVELAFSDGTMGFNATCTLGTASYPNDADNYNDLFTTADYALYIAKEKGKNRYVIYDAQKHGKPDAGRTGTLMSINNMRINKVSFVCNIVKDFLVNKTMSVYETLKEIGICFELDGISIFWGDKMETLFCWGRNEALNCTSNYVFTENYVSNFNENDVFVIDNIHVLEGRYENAYKILLQQNVTGTVQLLIQKHGEIKGLISYYLCEKRKKWSSMDIDYLTIIGRTIAGVFVDGETE